MKAWRVDLTCNNQSLSAVDIQREIPLTVNLRISESAYQFFCNKEKINHLSSFHG